MSRPSRARGLKRVGVGSNSVGGGVAPLAGAWIETRSFDGLRQAFQVAPLAGAWIETCQLKRDYRYVIKSRPSRARGLKPRITIVKSTYHQRRAPRGRVD